MKNTYAFLLTFLAGISTVLGVIPIYFKISKNIVLNVFRIAIIVLTVISLGELLPDGFKLIYRHFNTYITLIISLFAFILGFILTKFLDSKVGEGTNSFYKVGLISLFATIIHNIPEGIITYITTTHDFKLGILIAVSIMLHNIPEGLIIAIPIYYAKNKRGLALLLTFVSGMSEFLGAILSYLFLSKYITDLILGIIYIFTAGIMIYVALFELYPILHHEKKTDAKLAFLNLHRDIKK